MSASPAGWPPTTRRSRPSTVRPCWSVTGDEVLRDRGMSEAEKRRLERLRRALLNIVAQVRDLDPDGRYTLSIQIVPREQPTQKSA